MNGTNNNKQPLEDLIQIAYHFGLTFKRVNSDYYKLLEHYEDKEETLDELYNYYKEKYPTEETDK